MLKQFSGSKTPYGIQSLHQRGYCVVSARKTIIQGANRSASTRLKITASKILNDIPQAKRDGRGVRINHFSYH